MPVFDFLADGTEAESAALIAQIRESTPVAQLAACEAAIEKASAKPILLALQAACASLCEDLRRLAKYARRSADTLPLPNGVFVGEQDRQRAYRHFLDALPTIHRLAIAPRNVSASLLQLQAQVTERERNARLANQLLSVTALARAEGNMPPLPPSLTEQLTRENTLAKAVRSTLDAHTARLLNLCNRVMTAFFANAEKTVDLEDHGRAADPYGTVELLNRLACETDLFLDEILLANRRLQGFL